MGRRPRERYCLLMLPSALREPAVLVLTALAGRAQHGYALIDDVARLSDGRIRLRTGTIYSMLDRLREIGLIEVEREEVVTSRLRRYYQLTETGAALLVTETEMLRHRANVIASSLRVPRTGLFDAADPIAPPGPVASSGSAVVSGDLAHRAVLYRGREQYLARTMPFILAGLEADEPVAVAVPGGNLEAIREALGPRVGAVHLVDMAHAGANPGRIIPAIMLAFVEAHPTRPVRIVTEAVWSGRNGLEYPACVQHEALTNRVLADRAVTVLCPYDAAQLGPVALRDAARTHAEVLDGGSARDNDAYAPAEAFDAYNQAFTDGAEVEGFDFDDRTLLRARAYAVGRATCLGLPIGRRFDVELVVGELASNSVHHGGGGGRIGVWAAEGYIACEVRDGGTLTDPLAGRRPVTHNQPGQYGLLIANRLADLVRTYAAEAMTVTRAYFRIAAP